MFELLTELGGKGLVDRLATDPAVKTLFVLYDLIPSDPLQPVEWQRLAVLVEPYPGEQQPAVTPISSGQGWDVERLLQQHGLETDGTNRLDE